jgi:hypothetical protein
MQHRSSIHLSKQTWLSLFIIAVLSLSLIVLAVARVQEPQNGDLEVKVLQKELTDKTNELDSLQKNYTDLQNQFTELTSPKIETQLGAKVLFDPSANKNYLWVTGEVYNRGLGTAYNAVLEVKLFIANSTEPVTVEKSLGDIIPYNHARVYDPFYADGTIIRWELTASCSASK